MVCKEIFYSIIYYYLYSDLIFSLKRFCLNLHFFLCRAVVEQAFDKYSELDQIVKFSTPKVLRLVEILRQVRPLNFVDPRKRRDKLENSETTKVETILEGLESGKVESAVEVNEIATQASVKVREELEDLIVEAKSDSSVNPPLEASTDLDVIKKQEQNCNLPVEETADSTLGSTAEELSDEAHLFVENPHDTVFGISVENVKADTKLVSEYPCKTVPKSFITDTGLHNCIFSKNACISCNDVTANVSGSTTNDSVLSGLPKQKAVKEMKVCDKSPCKVVCSSVIEDMSKSDDISTYRESCAHVSNSSPECTIKAVSESYTNDLGRCSNRLDYAECRIPLSGSVGESITNDFSKGNSKCVHFQNGIKEVNEQHVLNGNSGLLDGMQSTVQTHHDTTQTCCNICEAVVRKETEDGSVLEDDLCRLNIKESSYIDGCELGILTSCDLRNGTLSAKSELKDTARKQNIKNIILCNGFALDSDNNLPSPGNSQGNAESKLNGHIDPHKLRSKCKCASDRECVAKADIKSCDSVQNQFCMEACQEKDSITETSAPLATSKLPCEAVAAVATHINITTNSDSEATIEGSVAPIDCSDNSQENSVLLDSSKSTPAPKATTTNVTNLPTNSCTGLNSSNEADGSGSSAPLVSSEAAAMADTLALLLPGGGKGRKRRDDVKEKVKVHNPEDPDSVCGLIFVHHRNIAKIIYRLLKV